MDRHAVCSHAWSRMETGHHYLQPNRFLNLKYFFFIFILVIAAPLFAVLIEANFLSWVPCPVSLGF